MEEVEEKGKSKDRRVVYNSEIDRIVKMSNPTVIGMVGTVGTIAN